MDQNKRWKKVSDSIREQLRLTTYPIAIRLFEDGEEVPRKVRILEHKVCICQLGTYARRHHDAVGSIRERIKCAIGAACVGLIRTPERIRTGRDVVGLYVKDEKAGKRLQEYVPKLGDTGGRYRAIAFAPLDVTPFEPQVITVYATPARITRLIHASIYRDGGAVKSTTPVEASICTSIAKVMLNEEPVIDLPCMGDRKVGLADEDELMFSFPPVMAGQIVEGLERTYEFGMSVYPIRVYLDWEPQLSEAHTMTEEDLKHI